MMAPQEQPPLSKADVLTTIHGMIEPTFSGSLKYIRIDKSRKHITETKVRIQ